MDGEQANGSGANGLHLGVRIRALREGRSMSARELADRAGVTPAYLSRLENGRLSPTVSTLTRVMQALGEPVSRVFGDDDLAGPVVRVRDRRVIRNRGVDDYLLSPTRSGRLEVIETIIQPGEGSGEPPYSHPGDEECIVVLEGTLRVWVDDDEYDLRPGDAITFPCRSPHQWSNPATRHTRALWVLTPAGY